MIGKFFIPDGPHAGKMHLFLFLEDHFFFFNKQPSGKQL